MATPSVQKTPTLPRQMSPARDRRRSSRSFSPQSRSRSRGRGFLTSGGGERPAASPIVLGPTCITLDEDVTDESSQDRGRAGGAHQQPDDGRSTPPSSIGSSPDSKDKTELSLHADHYDEASATVELPSPFMPPSLACKGDGPRAMPDDSLPPVPELVQTSEIDEQDKATPDNWIARDTRLVRLTGKHPFNCEARISTLYEQGFITPSALFYVRNHGAVPKVNEEQGRNWTFEVTGLVQPQASSNIMGSPS